MYALKHWGDTYSTHIHVESGRRTVLTNLTVKTGKRFFSDKLNHLSFSPVGNFTRLQCFIK